MAEAVILKGIHGPKNTGDVYSGKNVGCIDEPLERAFLRMLSKHLAAGVNIEDIKNKLRNGFCAGEPKEQYVCRMKEELRI